METNILKSVKKNLNLDPEYSAFDYDILTHINAAFSTLNQLGVGPAEGFYLEDGSEDWGAYSVPAEQQHMVKTYLYLKVRMLFDPPTTSFLLSSMEKQLSEFEWRLNAFREEDVWENAQTV